MIVRINAYNKERPYERCQVYWSGCAPGNDLRRHFGFCRKLVMEAIVETKAETILQCMHGLRGSLHVTLEEGTWAAWLHALLKPHVTRVVVSDPRKNDLGRDGNRNDRRDARELAELLYRNKVKAVYHGEHGLRTF